ncbi:MAG: hypothetical protein PHU04_05445 [Candidatus Peribacteraceae bacterium]|nr:hypothetical protein [Candidatus Peribacteraceae bacterium]
MAHRNLFQHAWLSATGTTPVDENDPCLTRTQYDDFCLTDAIRPSTKNMRPVQGYRHGICWEQNEGIPFVIASITKEKLFEVFMEFTELLESEVDVVLETSHPPNARGQHRDMIRDEIDLPVLQSTLYDHEDMLVNDGFTGIAIVHPHGMQEVQLDEHKLVIACSANTLAPYEEVLQRHRIACNESIRMIIDAPHMHASCHAYRQEFHALAERLGCIDL